MARTEGAGVIPQESAKRLMDFLVAVVGLAVLSPLIAGLSVMVRLRLGSPVFFRQLRPGMDCKPFRIVKFRTMTIERDAAGQPLPDDQRLTPFGAWLRSTSLDELPELVNVVRGDMSLVGPRPLLMDYLEVYSPRQARRHELRPGITGWAQVNGRNAATWADKLEMDVWYVENQSLSLDLRILGLTLVSVIRREGISAEGHPTAPKFGGTD